MKKKKQNKFSIPPLSPTTHLLLAIGLFVISVFLARRPDVPAWEIDVFNAIYGLPDFLQPIFFVITQTGSIWMLAAILLLYLAKRNYHILLRFLLTGTLAYLLSGFAKDLWGRARPADILENIVNLDYVVRGPGFPSGHTALATALALTAGHYLPQKYRWIVPVWIIGVALSRMYLGIHFPMDILGGFAIGWASYAVFRHVRIYDVAYHTKKRSKNNRRASKSAK